MNIPEGFSTITPYFVVSGAERFIEFLVTAFDGEELGRSLRPDGNIANAQVRIGTSTVMVGEVQNQTPGWHGHFYLYVEDANAAMKHALDNGAALEMEVNDQPYGDRQGGVRDPFGNIWWLSQRLVKETYF